MFVYELVGDPQNVGIYRDYGIAILKKIIDPWSKKAKKKIQKLFKEKKLHMVIWCNKDILNYFDVTFKLRDSTDCPNQRENS